LAEEEKNIVDRLRNKDKGAFEYVYREYFTVLVSYSFRFVEFREDAEEIVQDIFIKFWDKCQALEPGSSVKNYLFRAARNSCINHLKHEKVKDNYRNYVIDFLERSSDPANDYPSTDKMQLVRAEIENLPPRCREIFNMSRFDGLKYQEIADHLGLSVKTVEVQMGKALRVLREKLKNEHP